MAVIKRGAIRPTTREEAVFRAMSMIGAIPTPPIGAPADAGDRPIAYRLKDVNGGDNPYAAHCAGWSYGNRTPTADCVGLVLWASGIDRLQPSYNGSSGQWLHCPSIIDDAHGAQVYCRTLKPGEKTLPGDWMVTRDHIGMIIRPQNRITDDLVVDCSPRHGRESAINTGLPWSAQCEVIRYKGYVNDAAR